jgi:hypothetical protein
MDAANLRVVQGDDAMSAKIKEAAQLFWGGNRLWLGPWVAATLEPVWHGDKRDIPPHGWRWRVGPHESDDQQQHDAAMQRAEYVTMGQLRSVGIRAAEFRRPDGTIKTLEMP